MRFETLEAWLNWQESLNSRGIELGLDRVRRVLDRLDLLKPSFRVITVAGTNGKGSVTSYAAAILQAGGLRTGRYLSPHILRYNERIAVDGTDVDDDSLCQAFDAVDRARLDEPLTYFEFGTLAAFEIFRRRNVDVAVLEVGLGGRLDAVNAVDADVGVVVSVGIDHVDWLGSEIEDIAREKAGIFRAGRPAIFGALDMPRSITTEAVRVEAPLLRYGKDFRAEREVQGWTWSSTERKIKHLAAPSLRGAHQFANAATAITAVIALEPSIADEAIREGIRRTRLPGRLQLLRDDPQILVDVGHNPDAAACIAEFLRADPRPTTAVLAMLADKDASSFVRELAPLVDRWELAGLEGARGQSARRLAERLLADGFELDTGLHANVEAAADVALRSVAPGERVIVLGSFHTVAEFLVYFDAKPGNGGERPG